LLVVDRGAGARTQRAVTSCPRTLLLSFNCGCLRTSIFDSPPTTCFAPRTAWCGRRYRSHRGRPACSLLQDCWRPATCTSWAVGVACPREPRYAYRTHVFHTRRKGGGVCLPGGGIPYSPLAPGRCRGVYCIGLYLLVCTRACSDECVHAYMWCRLVCMCMCAAGK
jgi:hypothetical protein